MNGVCTSCGAPDVDVNDDAMCTSCSGSGGDVSNTDEGSDENMPAGSHDTGIGSETETSSDSDDDMM